VRVLDWMIERIAGRAKGRSSPIGLVPTPQALDLAGLSLAPEALDQLLEVDAAAWLEETDRNREFLDQFGDRMPPALRRQHELLTQVLKASSKGAPTERAS
jgi:phosphoenolpyruvate carboxykinase (GTP)